MRSIRHGFVIISVTAALGLQGCSLAEKLPDPDEKQAVLERWNRCLQRFESNQVHYCDGHRRDILATYPAHLESQIDSLLRQQTTLLKSRSMMKNGFGYTLDASMPSTRDTRPQVRSKAE